MTLGEEVAWLRRELIHERKRLREARDLARELALVVHQNFGRIGPEIARTLSTWEEERGRAKTRRRHRDNGGE